MIEQDLFHSELSGIELVDLYSSLYSQLFGFSPSLVVRCKRLELCEMIQELEELIANDAKTLLMK